MIQSFPPEYRLRSSADFKPLHAGRRIKFDGLTLVYRRNRLGHARLGMAVSKKYGNAVQRNRLKRRVRDLFRCHPIRSTSVDILIYPTDGYSSIAEIRKMMGSLASALQKIIRKESSQP